MKKFEIGKRSEAESGGVLCCEVIKRTAKRVTYVIVQHAGRYNECKSEPKTSNIKNWEKGEVFFTPRGTTYTAF